MNRLLKLLAVAFNLSCTGFASAAAVYTYVGLPFTSVGAPYTNTKFVSGSFTVASPFAANMALTDISGQVTGYSFNDGVNTLSNTNSVVCAADNYGFKVSTGANGQILDWAITLCTPVSAIPNPVNAIFSIHNVNAVIEDYGINNATCDQVVGTGCTSLMLGQGNGFRNTSGSWSQTLVATAAPVVPALNRSLIALLGTLVLGLGLALLSRKKLKMPARRM